MTKTRHLEEIYKEIILNHYSNPRGCREFEKITAVEMGHNVSCGDKVEMKVDVENDEIKNISVCTSGCAICVSSGSIMYGLIKNDTVNEALSKINDVVDFIKGDIELNNTLNTKEVNSLAGIKKFPARLKCALLPWITARRVLKQDKKE